MLVPYASLCPRTQLELRGLEWKATGTHTLSNGLVGCTQDIICLADKQKIISEWRHQPRSQAIMGSLMSWRSCKTDPADMVAVSTTQLEATGDKIKFSSTPQTSQVPRLPSSAFSLQMIMGGAGKPSENRNSWRWQRVWDVELGRIRGLQLLVYRGQHYVCYLSDLG